MTGRRKGDKLEPKLALDMYFAEALARFTQTKPEEVAESIERSKAKKPPGNGPPRRPARVEPEKASPDRYRSPDDAENGD
jgi:hypothetical protein